MNAPKMYHLDLPMEAIDLIVTGLGELPAKHSHNLLLAISQQMGPQLQPAPEVPRETLPDV